MENQKNKSIEENIETLAKLNIGRNKYEQLKSFRYEDLSEEQKCQISNYENKNSIQTDTQKENIKRYHETVRNPIEAKKFSISAKELWKLFLKNFETVNNRPFIKIGGLDGITAKNLEPLIYYFSKDERFFKCDNLSNISVPSFDKGLLIIGNFGNGKTATMKTFEHIFKGISSYGFKGYSANEVVTMFEKCSKDVDRDEFENMMWRGTRYFDDLKTERIASNYGKMNIFKEILEERYNRYYPKKNISEKNIRLKTFTTCNYKEGHQGNMEEAVNEFLDKYGERVYDRIFEMFNIIEFKGESFRK